VSIQISDADVATTTMMMGVGVGGAAAATTPADTTAGPIKQYVLSRSFVGKPIWLEV
jgi:hypothetical protein